MTLLLLLRNQRKRSVWPDTKLMIGMMSMLSLSLRLSWQQWFASYNYMIIGFPNMLWYLILFILYVLEEDCKIICSIESIDTDWTWFYQGHDSCKKKVILIKSKSGNLDSTDKPVFWCTNCRINVTVVSPKWVYFFCDHLFSSCHGCNFF